MKFKLLWVQRTDSWLRILNTVGCQHFLGQLPATSVLPTWTTFAFHLYIYSHLWSILLWLYLAQCGTDLVDFDSSMIAQSKCAWSIEDLLQWTMLLVCSSRIHYFSHLHAHAEDALSILPDRQSDPASSWFLTCIRTMEVETRSGDIPLKSLPSSDRCRLQ
jgi:hypothetical protein